MRTFKRRIEKIGKELSIRKPDESAWWEDLRQRDPDLAKDIDEFFAMCEDDPEFQEELKKDKFSDKTINELADFCLERSQKELLKKQESLSKLKPE